MTNSDSGDRLTSEIMIAVAREYGRQHYALNGENRLPEHWLTALILQLQVVSSTVPLWVNPVPLVVGQSPVTYSSTAIVHAMRHFRG